MNKKVTIIGAGFSGLATASLLAKSGFQVQVFEKNEMAGGRARSFQSDGFTFDMGPSWYWMPDVFDNFFSIFGKKTSDYYELIRLDPSYRFYFGKDDKVDVPADFEGVIETFESIEKGSGKQLEKFLEEAEYKYKVSMNKFVFKPGLSILEFMHPELLSSVFKLHMFRSFDSHLRKFFPNPRLRQMLEFPILFLGGTAKNTPALYSLMNYGDIKLGTWYPKGGMYKVVEAMVELAESQGVSILYDCPVENIIIQDGSVTGVNTKFGFHPTDLLVASADYQFVEQTLLPSAFRDYSKQYWDSRVLSPSSLIFFLGIDKKLEGIEHHTLFFDEDLGAHASQIYSNPSWPDKPSLYFSCTSKTDTTVAPEGMENLFVLIPVAPGLEDTEEMRNKYYEIIMDRFKMITGQDLRDHVVFQRSYAHKDFEADYHAFKGNAYGLANTLMQTAFLKPRIKNRKLDNLYYTGQLTVPGPGVPPALISGQIVANEISKRFKKG
ncbi:MAG: phytoene desaturase [Bacteroidales bacterium]|nr:phytoene desaturase [Bacteroidales bacterium]